MMESRKVLLAYASLYGSTREVADTIAEELRAQGLDVEEAPAQQVQSLEPYAAVVLGAAIYGAKWNPDAHQFVQRHQEALLKRPIAVFTLGPISASATAVARSWRQLEAELALYPWLKPIAVEVFGGKIDPAKLGLIYKLTYGSRDLRDWNAIRAWARSLAAQMQQKLALPTPA